MKRIIALILTLTLAVFALASCGRTPVDISGATDIQGLAGAKIGAQAGTFHLDALNDQLGDIVDVAEYEDFDKLLIALKAGTIDGYIAEEPTALAIVAANPELDFLHFVNNSTGFTATDADTGIAVAFKTGSAMVSQVNAIIANISTSTRSALMQQAVTMSTSKDTALNEAIALQSSNTSTANGTLKVAMECAYDPFNWTQTTAINGAVPISGTDGLYANGYDVQIAKYIAAELGMALEISAVEWDSLIAGLEAETYDAIIAGMSPTAEREAVVDFTDCYYNSNLVVIYKKAN